MNDEQTTRRRFILAALTFSTVATTSATWLQASQAWALDNEDAASATMVRLARLLFPHDGMPDTTYSTVMDNVFATLASSPASESVLLTAETALDSRREALFMDLGEADQVAVIRELQSEAFITALIASVRGSFYYHPLVWEHIGYPGSSKEFGGYINRGFDDIDWLPADA